MNITYIFHCVQVQFSRSNMNTFFSLAQLIFQFENLNFIIELKSFGHTNRDLSNYRQAYLHHVKTGLHTTNIRANKNTSYFFASQMRNNLHLEVPPLIRGPPPIAGETSDQKSHLQLEVSPPGGIFCTIWGDHNT